MLSKEKSAYFAKSIENFTTNLIKQVADREEGNFVFSGLSVHLSGSMCALGAEENTAKEMLDVLHINKDCYADFRNFTKTHLENVRDIELNVANGIFVSRDMEVKDSFKKQLNKFFEADVTDVDFGTEQAVKDMNNWCAEKSKNKIKQLIRNGDVSDGTR